jgi:plastocyanin
MATGNSWANAQARRKRPAGLYRYCPSRDAAFTFGLSFVVTGAAATIALAAENHIVSQKNRAFSLNSLLVNKGDVVQFVNDDEFIHQVYVQSDDFNVDTEESSPGNTISVPFTVSGTFEVHCHIHPKMRLVVTVR